MYEKAISIDSSYVDAYINKSVDVTITSSSGGQFIRCVVLEKNKAISEDEKFRGVQSLQKLIDKYNLLIEEILKNKEKEILEF